MLDKNIPNKSGEAPDPGRLKPASYERVRRLVYEKAGIDLRQGKEELVSSRLAKKLHETRCTSYEEYLDRVAADRTGESLTALIDALTTNVTSFMREPAHFEFLRNQVFPQWAQRKNIEVWCAAAATGEEPYSLLCTLLDHFGPLRLPCRLVATDISTRALEKARKATYAAERLSHIPKEWLSKYFLRGQGPSAGLYQARPEVARQIEFRRLNLIGPFELNRAFPLISCRNVMIYFDRPTQERVVNRMCSFLEPGGYLFVGHSESLNGLKHPLTFVQPAVYRMPGGSR